VDSGHPNTVVIPIDGHAFKIPNTAKYTSRGSLHRRNRKAIEKIDPGWQLQKGVDVLNASPGKHFK
jgi:hypothetical protein